MTKKQKIWFAVFLSMFAIPFIVQLIGFQGTIEIPWLPIIDFNHLGNILLAYFVTLVPTIGLIGMLLIIRKLRISKWLKILFFLILIPLICIFAFSTVILIAIMIYYGMNNGGPQIG